MKIYIYTYCVHVYFVLYYLTIMRYGQKSFLTNSIHIYSMAGNSIHGYCVVDRH